MSFFTKINSKMSVGMAATILSGSYLSSAVLGLLRDRLLAAKFGIGSDALDSYIAAFSIPDLLYFFLVTGALSVTLIPVFVDRMKNSNKQSAWELSSSVINLMALVTFVSSIIIFIFASQLVYLTAPGFGADRHDLATAIMRIIAISPFIFSIST
nr:virulence factor MviN [Candidatus Saccharibacteria bacterium]